MKLEPQFESQLRPNLIRSVGEWRDEKESRWLGSEERTAGSSHGRRNALQLFQGVADLFAQAVQRLGQRLRAVAGDADREDERDARRALSYPASRTQSDFRRADV